MDLRTRYLGWDRPFSLLAADYLATLAGGSRELDQWLVWVPSARAGRHILNQMFACESTGMEALHPPRLMTPAQFIRSMQTGPRQASTAQQLFAWKRVLLASPPGELEPLFPVLPREQQGTWAYSIARQLIQLRLRLAEDGFSFQEVAAGAPVADGERWRVMASLEKNYLSELETLDLLDPQSRFPESLKETLTQFSWSRVLVAGILNLSRRQETCLRALAGQNIPVEVLVPAPESEAGSFDSWGRPLPGEWDRMPIPSDLLKGRVLRSGEPRALAESVLSLAGHYREEIDAMVVGVPDRELGHYLVERSRLTSTPLYAPEGKPLAQTAWGKLIRLITDWRQTRSVSALQELLRHALFRKWARSAGLPLDKLETTLVLLLKERLLRTADQLLGPELEPDPRIALLRETVQGITTLLENAPAGASFPEWLWSVLSAIAAGQELAAESREVLSSLEEFLQDLLVSFDAREMGFEDYCELLQYQLDASHYYPERAGEERPVSGWLELPWERSPHLVILGLPDNQVPGPDLEDPFLTPALCRQLGLYGPDQAAAFHAFRLRLLLESRRNWGRLDLLLPDRGLDDSPVLPTRFLFLAENSEITGRVRLLLQEQPVPESSLPVRFGPALRLPEPVTREGIRVTDLSAYLRDPFRCYLERICGWSIPQALPRELDALQFGTLAHRVLEDFNKEEEAVELSGEKAIREFLHQRLQDRVTARMGRDPGVAIRIQVDSLMERFRALAPVLAGERQAGWRPVKVEWSFHEDLLFKVGGLPLRGTVDLLERNSGSGEYRILDYKTSDKSDGPEKAHLAGTNSRSPEAPFPECEFSDGKKTWRWRDLQLPLYRLAVEQSIGVRPRCGYVCLTKAFNEVRLEEWTPSEEQDAGAMACAEAIVGLMQSGHFPLPEKPAYRDDWLPWFGGDYLEAVHPDWVNLHSGAKS